MTGNGNGRASINDMLSDVGEAGINVVALATLQAELAMLDLKEASRHATPGLIGMGLAVPLAMAAFVLILLGASNELAARAHLSQNSAMMVVGAGALLVAAIAAFLSVKRVKRSLASFRRSGEELERNMTWLRTVMLHGGRR